MSLDTNLEFYYGKPDDMGSHNTWVIFNEPQKKHMAAKLCSLFDKRDKMLTINYEELLLFINALMVEANDVTYNHFQKMVIFSKMRNHRNPILLDIHSEGERTGNPTSRRNAYRRYVNEIITGKGYDWTYEEMAKSARAFKKGIPTNEISIKDMPTSDEFINEVACLKEEIAMKANFKDVKQAFVESNEDLINAHALISEQRDMIDALTARLDKLEAYKPKMVVNNTDKPAGMGGNDRRIRNKSATSELANKIKAMLAEDNERKAS